MAMNGTGTKDDPVIVTELAADEVPGELRPSNFFDLDRYPFEHRALVDGARSVVDLIGKDGIEKYATEWLAEKIGSARGAEERTGLSGIGNYTVLVEPGAVCEPLFVHGFLDGEGHTLYVARGAKVVGAVIYLDGGDVYVGEGAVIEPTAGVKGPTIIGPNNEIRQGAYLRGNIILGGHKNRATTPSGAKSRTSSCSTRRISPIPRISETVSAGTPPTSATRPRPRTWASSRAFGNATNASI